MIIISSCIFTKEIEIFPDTCDAKYSGLHKSTILLPNKGKDPSIIQCNDFRKEIVNDPEGINR